MRQSPAPAIILFFDIIALALAMATAALIASYLSENIFNRPAIDFHTQYSIARIYTFIFMSLIVLFTFYNRGHYTRRIPWWSQIRYILLTIIFTFVIDGFMHFAVKYQFSRLWIGFSWINAFFFILLARYIAYIVCKKLNCWTVDTIVIGNGQSLIDTLFAIHSDNYTGYKVHTLILHEGAEKFERMNLPLQYQQIDIIEGIEDYENFIKKNRNNFYILAPDAFQDLNIEHIVNVLVSCDSNYAIVPPIKGISLYGLTPQYFFGHDTMFLNARQKITSPTGRIFKRAVDIIGSGAALLLASPILLIITALIRKDGGNAFYSQPRIGIKNSQFECLKFRSMRVDAEQVLQEMLNNDPKAKEVWKTHRKLKNDPRVTKVGAILRKTSLDEIPQLINVLKGDMSLVGPRPILPDETHFFDQDQFATYCSTKPGITGLWQVSGRNDTTFKQRVYLDTWYVKNWSFWHDIVILLKTVGVLAKRVGVY